MTHNCQLLKIHPLMASYEPALMNKCATHTYNWIINKTNHLKIMKQIILKITKSNCPLKHEKKIKEGRRTRGTLNTHLLTQDIKAIKRFRRLIFKQLKSTVRDVCNISLMFWELQLWDPIPFYLDTCTWQHLRYFPQCGHCWSPLHSTQEWKTEASRVLHSTRTPACGLVSGCFPKAKGQLRFG